MGNGGGGDVNVGEKGDSACVAFVGCVDGGGGEVLTEAAAAAAAAEAACAAA